MPPRFGSRPNAPEFPMLAGIIPPFIDIVAKTFRISVNHTQRQICVSGIVSNEGNALPGKAVQVAIGVTVVIAGVTRSQQEIFTIPSSALLPGVQVETECSTAPLVYLDEDSGAKYTLELLVDFNHEVADLDRGDNYRSITTWWTNPKNSKLTRIGDIAAELKPRKR